VRKLVLTAVGSLFVLTTASYAFPIKLTNTRPVTVASSSILQGDLNQIYGPGVVPVNSELNLAIFQVPSAVSLKLTVQSEDNNTALANTNRFGIFGLTQTIVGGHPAFDIHGNPILDSSTIKTQEIFKGPASAGAVATVNLAPGGIKIGGSNPLSPGTCISAAVDCGQTAAISFSYFGFYLYRPLHATNNNNDTGTHGYQNAGGNPGGNFWTTDQLNVTNPTGTSKGNTRALIYQGSNVNQWTVAFDDVSSTHSFKDFVVTVQASRTLAAAVPEPGAIFLFGTAVLACVTLLRRKMRQQN